MSLICIRSDLGREANTSGVRQAHVQQQSHIHQHLYGDYLAQPLVVSGSSKGREEKYRFKIEAKSLLDSDGVWCLRWTKHKENPSQQTRN